MRFDKLSLHEVLSIVAERIGPDMPPHIRQECHAICKCLLVAAGSIIECLCILSLHGLVAREEVEELRRCEAKCDRLLRLLEE